MTDSIVIRIVKEDTLKVFTWTKKTDIDLFEYISSLSLKMEYSRTKGYGYLSPASIVVDDLITLKFYLPPELSIELVAKVIHDKLTKWEKQITCFS